MNVNALYVYIEYWLWVCGGRECGGPWPCSHADIQAAAAQLSSCLLAEQCYITGNFSTGWLDGKTCTFDWSVAEAHFAIFKDLLKGDIARPKSDPVTAIHYGEMCRSIM